jgi:hypothetical protein
MLSCTSEKDFSGLYASARPSKKEFKLLKTNSSYSNLNSKLSLSKDSTFTMKNCGLLSYGNWTFKNDSIILNVKKAFALNDSINPIRKNVGYSTKYKVFKNSLIAKSKLISEPNVDVLDKYVLEKK